MSERDTPARSQTTNGALRARAGGVDGLGAQLLAGAGLALDEHGDVGLRHQLEHGEDLAHLERGAEQRAEALARRRQDRVRALDRGAA